MAKQGIHKWYLHPFRTFVDFIAKIYQTIFMRAIDAVLGDTKLNSVSSLSLFGAEIPCNLSKSKQR